MNKPTEREFVTLRPKEIFGLETLGERLENLRPRVLKAVENRGSLPMCRNRAKQTASTVTPMEHNQVNLTKLYINGRWVKHREPFFNQ